MVRNLLSDLVVVLILTWLAAAGIHAYLRGGLEDA